MKIYEYQFNNVVLSIKLYRNTNYTLFKNSINLIVALPRWLILFFSQATFLQMFFPNFQERNRIISESASTFLFMQYSSFYFTIESKYVIIQYQRKYRSEPCTPIR